MGKILHNKPKSILIIRLSAIGDIVMASGVIPVLRKHFPEASLDWLVQSECAQLLQGHAGLRRTISWPRQTWQQLWSQGKLLELSRQFRSLVKELRSQEYDLVLDLQGLWKSAWLAWICKSGHKVGLDSREGSKWVLDKVCRSSPGDRRMASEYLHLLQELGLHTQDFHLGLQSRSEDQIQARELLQAHGVQGEYAVFCPFSTREQKLWPLQHWLVLAGLLQERVGLQMVLLGGPADREMAEYLQSKSSCRLVNLAGETNLIQSLALVKGASLLIGVDTGLTHMGIMSQTPSVALFGSTCPYLWTGRQDSVVLYQERDCSPCRRHPNCNGQYQCMQDLSPELVCQTAASLLPEGAFGAQQAEATRQVQG
ncbi:MAG: glycosyltransferase family 9 protein [Thermodesulfobacteriota bacterium]